MEEECPGYTRGSALRYVNLDPSETPEATFSQSNPVSQFTLYGNLKKGNKPDFHDAADVETARRLYDYFYNRMRDSYRPESVKNGVFQAMMEVELKNDGPVRVFDPLSMNDHHLPNHGERVGYY